MCLLVGDDLAVCNSVFLTISQVIQILEILRHDNKKPDEPNFSAESSEPDLIAPTSLT